MRDAIGGTYMMRLLLIFLAVYTIFIAIAINYAKAFRVKNKIIDIIEQNEGIKDYNDDKSLVNTQIETYLNNISYGVNVASLDNQCNGYDYINTTRGYCIDRVKYENAEYYKVRTFVVINIPIIEGLSFRVPISGETRKIERLDT